MIAPGDKLKMKINSQHLIKNNLPFSSAKPFIFETYITMFFTIPGKVIELP